MLGRPSSSPGSSALATSSYPRFSAGLCCLEERTAPDNESYPPKKRSKSRERIKSRYVRDLSTGSRKPPSTERNPLASLRNLLYQSAEEDATGWHSGHRSRTRSASDMLRSTERNSQRYEMEFQEQQFTSASPEFPESYGDFRASSAAKVESLSDYHIDDFEDSEDLVSSDDAARWGRNKNFSSSAERDRNSSSGNGDSWYPEYAYRCGVIDTLRLLDSDFALSTPSGELIQQYQSFEKGNDSSSRLDETDEQLSYIVKSIPSLTANRQNDETFEIIRQNSLRALLYAAKLSVDWPPISFYDKPAGKIENWVREIKDCSSSSHASLNGETRKANVKPDTTCISQWQDKVSNDIEHGRILSKRVISVAPPVPSKAPCESVRQQAPKAVSPKASATADFAEKLRTAESQHKTVENTEAKVKHIFNRLPHSRLQECQDRVCSMKNNDKVHHPQKYSVTLDPKLNHNLDKESKYDHVQIRGKNDLEPRKVTLRRATLSPAEENRLRGAISRKLGTCQNFSLVPLRLCEPAPPADSCQLNRQGQSPGKKVQSTAPDNLKQRTTADNATKNNFAIDSLEEAADGPSQSNVALYVIAVDKTQENEDETGSGSNSHNSGTEPMSFPNPFKESQRNALDVAMTTEKGSVSLSGSKRYYIFTRDELIKTVAGSRSFHSEGLSKSELPKTFQPRPQTESKIGASKLVSEAGGSMFACRSTPWQPDLAFPNEKDSRKEATPEDKSKSVIVEDRLARSAGERGIRGQATRGEEEDLDKLISSRSYTTDHALSSAFNLDTRCGLRTLGGIESYITNNEPGRQSTESYSSSEPGRQRTESHSSSEPGRQRTESYSSNLPVTESEIRAETPDVMGCLENMRTSSRKDEELFCYKPMPFFKTTSSYSEEKPGLSRLDHEENMEQSVEESSSETPFLRQTPSEHRSTDVIRDLALRKESEKPEKRSGGGDGNECVVLHQKSNPEEHGRYSRFSEESVTQRLCNVNRTSSSDLVNSISKTCRKSKSSNDVQFNLEALQDGISPSEITVNQCMPSEDTLAMLHALVDGKLKVYFDKALERWTSPGRKKCSLLTAENTVSDQKAKMDSTSLGQTNSKKVGSSSLSSEYMKRPSSLSVTSLTDTMTEKSITEESVVILSLPAGPGTTRKHRTYVELTQQQNEKLIEWIKSSVPEIAAAQTKTGEAKEKYVLSVKRKRMVSGVRGCRRSRPWPRKYTSSSSSGNVTNSANDDRESDASVNRQDLPGPKFEVDWSFGVPDNVSKSSASRERDRQRSPVKVREAGPSRPRRCGSGKPVTRSESRRRSVSRSQSVPRRKRNKKRTFSTPRRDRNKKKANVKVSSHPNSPSLKTETEDRAVASLNKGEKMSDASGHPARRTPKIFATSGVSRVARALANPRRMEFEYVPPYCTSPVQNRYGYSGIPDNDFKKPELNDSFKSERDHIPNDDSEDDSLEACEGFESCLLTPIKEESRSREQSNSDRSKSDFETFVNKCRRKLLQITDDTRHGVIDTFGRALQSSDNTCSSSSFKRSTSDSASRKSREDTPSDEKMQDCRGSRHQEVTWGQPEFRCDHAELKQTDTQFRDHYMSYMQCKGPFKSAFLRKEMNTFLKEPARPKERASRKKEDELMRTYVGGSKRSSYFRNMAVNPSWPSLSTNINVSWRKTDSDRLFLPSDTPTYIRSVPGVTCQSLRRPGMSASQTRSLSSMYSSILTGYGSAYLRTPSPRVTEYADVSSFSKMATALPRDRSSNALTSRWYSADCVDPAGSHRDFIRKNWNESANNGNDGSSSADTSGHDDLDNDQRSEYSMKSKTQPGRSVASNDHSDAEKPSRELRFAHKNQDQYFRQSQHLVKDDPHDLCCEHACMSYDYIHPNYQMARVSNFAARNINGSGNMFGRGLYPSDERMTVMMEHDGDSDEEFTSATEELPHYTSGAKKRAKTKRKVDLEIDDTCNHPDSISYYIGDGPAGQFDTFEGMPKEDHLISLSPMADENQMTYCTHRQLSTTCQKSSCEAVGGQASTCSNKPGRSDCEIHGPVAATQALDKNHILPGRSCFGQGDIINKRTFTHWYVDDPDKSQQVQRRPTVNAATSEKCSHRELWVTPSENCESPVEDGEEEDENDNDVEEDDEDAEENDEEDGEDDDDNDEDEDDEDDEDNEEEEEEEDDDDVEENRAICGGEVDENRRILQQKPAGGEHFNDRNSQKNYQHERGLDMNESKVIGKRLDDLDAPCKRPIRARTIAQTKRYATAAKPGHQQSTGDHLNKQKQPGAHEKNAHAKAVGGHQHKFSLEQIKVPAIEKERVRFACDENGDWAEIGRGSYGCVYLGLLDGIIEVAIKDFYESSSWDLVIHEARMLMFLQDTGITPKFYGLRRRFDVNKQPSEYCIIMEYFGDGRTLFNVMSDKLTLGGDEWMDVVGQLVAGLRLIHRKNVLINDLKADNILIDLTGGRKIIRYIDVGMATYKQGLTFQLPQDQMSKYNFLAPEVREGARTTTRSDIYSLGYMLEQMCRMADSALGGLKKLVARCMEKNPARRPDIDDIVSQVHRFIASKASVMIKSSSPREQFVLTNSV